VEWDEPTRRDFLREIDSDADRLDALISDLLDTFQRVRRGARITRRYDSAQTPYRRLLASGALPRKAERQLAARSAALNPLRLKLELESAQRTVAERGVHPFIAHSLRSEEL
jgi:hypothetical protein